MKGGRINEHFLSQLALALFPLVEEVNEILTNKELSHRTKVLCVRLAFINSEAEVKKALIFSANKLFGDNAQMEFKAGRAQECHLPEKSNIVVTYYLN